MLIEIENKDPKQKNLEYNHLIIVIKSKNMTSMMMIKATKVQTPILEFGLK